MSSATIFRFHLFGAPDLGRTSDRPFVLFDASGASFKPVRNGNRQTGRSSFRIKPAGASNLTEEALEVDTIAEIAKAMIVDRLPARTQSTAGGVVNYLAYGKQKLVRYELDPDIARQIGVPSQGSAQDGEPADISLPLRESNLEAPMNQPTNLILYGPPGTGKTFATAQEAVRLCGEAVPEDRAQLMAIYRQLLEAGRIEFVTFHQSVAYEDFVEGLRPTQTTDEGGAGFELKVVQGVFRRIARRAETSTGSGNVHYSLDGRQVFKMSIGEAFSSEDAHLFEEAIEGGYTLLGFEEIDWTGGKYSSREAIIEAVRAEGTRGGEPNASSGRVQMPFIFRNGLRKGDIIVVSKGNSLFRAIGEVSGDYNFAPREGGGYAHRKPVRWLWIDRAGVPVSEIYGRSFSQKSIYLLDNSDLNRPALERYIASQQSTGSGKPESFVLIIDEINRANISKVFGELITLLEPDKRLGQQNALKVRLPYSAEMFGVPSNLHIIGTMNTADRSIALLDTALRRRFEFKELMPDASVLSQVDGIDLPSLLNTINERIEYLFDREHQIGHAYFFDCRTREDVEAVVRYKVIPLLVEYFYEDWSKVAAVLGDAAESEGSREGRFIDRVRLIPPNGMAQDEETSTRYRWKVRQTFSFDEFSPS
ncbi:AAA domain family protein [Sinorhizobium sp. RAC02]|nr:AAA domain family protein [Sinorhizobium sp. RAC02]